MMQKIVSSIALRKIDRWIAWLLAIAMVLIFISGYALIGKTALISRAAAWAIHRRIMILAITLFILHAAYGVILLLWQRKMKKEANTRKVN